MQRTVRAGVVFFKGHCHEIFYNRFVLCYPVAILIILKICDNIRNSKCTTGVVDTGSKFTTGVNNTFYFYLIWVYWYIYCIVPRLQYLKIYTGDSCRFKSKSPNSAKFISLYIYCKLLAVLNNIK